MVDFSVFDSILDSAFVLDSEGKVVYCNDAAATFCQSSARRLIGKAILSDVLSLQEDGIFPFTTESKGRTEPTPFIETECNLVKVEKKAKVQFAVRPIDTQHWLFFLRDVSLEEALHSKYRSELAQKEDYARNLEKLVEARTAELNRLNQTLNAILDSLGQGFFTFDTQGDCGDVYTKACEDVLEGIPKGKKAWDVLRIPSAETEQFQKWYSSMFKELLPFEDMKALGPTVYSHSQDKHVTLDYYPIRRQQEQISDVVVVATDKTSEYKAQMALEAERQYAAMVVKFTKNKDQFLQFLASVKKSISTLQGLAAQPLNEASINESFRILHTIEGEAGTFSLRDLRQSSRASQHVLEPFKGQKSMESSAEFEFKKSLEDLKVQFERFLTENADLLSIPEEGESRRVEVSVQALQAHMEQLQKLSVPASVLTQFQDAFFKVTFESSLGYFDSLVQTVAERLGKKVKPLIIEGGQERIFPEPYQNLFASLVHAFRNAVDHGLEEPDEREWAGKDRAGQIRVKIETENGQYKMVIIDDGKGIDPNVIREKLKIKYPDKDFISPSDEEIIQNVCMPGFSSRESVGEFSGRGVGLDALREEVLKLGGSIRLQSKVGQGTEIVLRFPKLGYQSALLRSA